jgi:hypothetical protein
VLWFTGEGYLPVPVRKSILRRGSSAKMQRKQSSKDMNGNGTSPSPNVPTTPTASSGNNNAGTAIDANSS